MRKMLIAVVLMALAFPAVAQQPQEDPRIATYKFLLGEANDRITNLSAQGTALEAKVKALEAEKAKAGEPKPAPADKP